VENIEQACQEFQGKEIPSSMVGEKVMKALQSLDGVAYVGLPPSTGSFATSVSFWKNSRIF